LLLFLPEKFDIIDLCLDACWSLDIADRTIVIERAIVEYQARQKDQVSNRTSKGKLNLLETVMNRIEELKSELRDKGEVMLHELEPES